MRIRGLFALMALAILVCILVTTAHAARNAASFDGHMRGLDFSRAVPGNLSCQGHLVDAIDSTAGLFDGSPMWLQMEVGAEILSTCKPLVSEDGRAMGLSDSIGFLLAMVKGQQLQMGELEEKVRMLSAQIWGSTIELEGGGNS